jgi:oligopeptide/dipeptide ABC transporter ATP-binding protein
MGLVPVPPGRFESGRILFEGRNLLDAGEKELRAIRGSHISMIFQDPLSALNPVFKVGHQIAEVIQAHERVGRFVARRRAVELLGEVGIPNPRQQAEQYPHQFSGGMRQRAMIAMALALDPVVLLADEPTTALDVTVQAQVLDTLERIQEKTEAAIILITHDLGVVAGMADKVLVMYAGKPVEVGTVDDIYYQPRMPYTLGLLGSLPRLDARGDERLTPIKGSPPSLVNLPVGCPFSPRCPMSRPHCEQEEPLLREVGGSSDHVAACHYSEELAGGVRADEVFETAQVNLEALEELEALDSVEQGSTEERT